MAIGVAQETCTPATGGMTGSGTTFTSSSITVAAGSILVAVAVGVTGTNVTGFSDSVNGGTGWSVAKVVNNAPLVVAMGWRYFSTGQTVTVTATYNATTDHRGIKLLEITGAVTPGALDGTPAGQFQNNVATTTDAVTSGSLTTSAQPALVVGACMDFGNNHNAAAGTGFTSTRVDWNTDVGGCRIEYKRVTATGTQAATYTAPAIDSWITLAAAFDEAPAGASQVPLMRDTVAARLWLPGDPWPTQARVRAALLPSAPIDSPIPGWARRLGDRVARDWWEPGDPWPTQRRKLLVIDTPPVSGQPPFVRRLVTWQEDQPWPAQRRTLLIVDTPAVSQPPFVRRLVPGQDEQAWPQQRRLGQPPVAAPPLLTREWLYQAVASWADPEQLPQRRRFLVLAPVLPDSPPLGWPGRLVTLRVRDTWEPPDPIPQQLRRSGIVKVPASFVLLQGPFYAVVDHVELSLDAGAAILAVAVDSAELTEQVDGARTSIAVDSVTTTVDR